MAKRIKKEERDSSGDWLNTYADMVTLVLTFFVLLYSTSSLDQQKWQYILQSLVSRGTYVNTVVLDGEPGDSEDPIVVNADTVDELANGNLPQSFDQLYLYLQEYVKNSGYKDDITVGMGKTYLYIRFQNNVFFDGDSAILKDDGKKVLNVISPAINSIQDKIMNLTVSGHTAVGQSNVNDWELSSSRASNVLNYLAEKDTVPEEKFKLKALGPYEPIASNETEDEKAKNRRVELILTKSDLDLTDLETLQELLKQDYDIDSEFIDPDSPDNSKQTEEYVPETLHHEAAPETE